MQRARAAGRWQGVDIHPGTGDSLPATLDSFIALADRERRGSRQCAAAAAKARATNYWEPNRMRRTGRIDYLEFPARDLTATRTFFSAAFGWRFIDYGPDYIAFEDAGIQGGFYRSELCARSAQGSALVVLYSSDLEQTQREVEEAGGTISNPIFQFPGGRRFHFLEPSGNELAVWSDQGL